MKFGLNFGFQKKKGGVAPPVPLFTRKYGLQGFTPAAQEVLPESTGGSTGEIPNGPFTGLGVDFRAIGGADESALLNTLLGTGLTIYFYEVANPANFLTLTNQQILAPASIALVTTYAFGGSGAGVAWSVNTPNENDIIGYLQL